MSDAAKQLKAFQPSKDFFVGIDSDGCVFDSMEIKHKECFTPMFIKHFGLQPVSKYAREVWEFVNLYSKTRGINRFPALSNALDFLKERPEVQARNVEVSSTDALDEWIARESKLGNATLEAEVQGGNQSLADLYEWSKAVNGQVEDIVHGVPPFPLVRECFDKIREKVDEIAMKEEQNGLEVNLMVAWFLAEMRIADDDLELFVNLTEEDKEELQGDKLELSWAKDN